MTSGPRQKSTLNFVLRASIFHSPFFFWTLALAQVACISLPAPSLHHIQLLPLPFWFCCWVPEGLGVVEDLAHAAAPCPLSSPPPPPEKAAALGFLLWMSTESDSPRWWYDACICMYFVKPGEGSRPTPTQSPGRSHQASWVFRSTNKSQNFSEPWFSHL